MMKVLREILTILNLCSVHFYRIFHTQTSLHQSLVPAIIVQKEIRKYSQKSIKSPKSIQPQLLIFALETIQNQLIFNAETIDSPTIDPGPSIRMKFDNRMLRWSKTSSLNAKLIPIPDE
jgi:hypothetical protein